MTEECNYKIINKSQFELIVFSGALPEDPPDEFVEYIKEKIATPQNISINLFLAENLPIKWLDNISVLNSQLPLLGKRIALIYTPTTISELFKQPKLKSVPHFDSLQEALHLFDKHSFISKNITFIKAFMSSTIGVFFLDALVPVVRQKIFIKKPEDKNFLGEYSGLFTYSTKSYFFNISISFTKEFFEIMAPKLVPELKNSPKKDQIKALTQKIVISSQKLAAKSEAFSLSKIQTLTGDELPPTKINWKDEEYNIENNNTSVVVPFSSEHYDGPYCLDHF